MNNKNKLWLTLGAVIVILGAVFFFVKFTGNETEPDLIANYDVMDEGTLLDIVGEEVYYIVMDMVQFIKGEKFVNADFEANSGDTQLSLGEDYAVLAAFDEVYNQYLMSVSNDSNSAESDIQYLLQTVGAGLSAQIQQKALMIQISEIEAEPDRWTHLDMSQMPEVLAVYASLAQDAVNAVESENMIYIREYFDEQPWNDKLKPYADYLATFSEELAVYE